MRVGIAIGLALCLAVVPLTPTRAASPPSPDAEPLPANADPIAQVRALYELGLVRYEAAEYDQALIMWKQAFGLLSHDLDQQPARAGLVANIVAAHIGAYAVARNPEHLAEAMRVIDLRKAELAQLHSQGEDTVGEMLRLDKQRTELARRHELTLSEGELPRPLASGTAFRIAPAPSPALTREELDAAVAADPELGSSYRRGNALTTSGTIVLALGGVALGGALVVAVKYIDPKDSDRRDMIPKVIPLGAVGVSAAIVGISLLGVGSKRKRQARQDYQNQTAMVVPMSLPHGGGLGFVGRF